MAVVLREEVSLLEVELGEVVVAYVEHLEREGELELEVATEFLVLIAALLELKSRLLLPGPRTSSRSSGPRRRSRSCSRGCSSTAATASGGRRCSERFEAERGYLYRSAPLPAELRRVALEAATAVYDPERLGAALGDLLTSRRRSTLSHIRPTVSLERRLRACATLLRRRAASTSTRSSAARTG